MDLLPDLEWAGNWVGRPLEAIVDSIRVILDEATARGVMWLCHKKTWGHKVLWHYDTLGDQGVEQLVKGFLPVQGHTPTLGSWGRSWNIWIYFEFYGFCLHFSRL